MSRFKNFDSARRMGEHYITRNKRQYFELFKKGLCGGLMMAFTTVIKFSLALLHTPVLLKGLMASLNYSATFLGIYFFQFTLGTKQPALTASALAARIETDPEAVSDDIIHLVRSQLGALAGNILGVIPVVALMSLISQYAFHHQFLGPAKAWGIVQEFSIFGPTPLYAYWTGVLLFLSNLFASWAERKFSGRRLTPFWRKNGFAMAANVSLGFLLAFVPLLCQALGVHLDVRHVTLSSGSLTLAAFELPKEALLTADFWLGIAGILSMAFLNVTVSFGLTLAFAVKKRKVQAPQRKLIYGLLLKRLAARPWMLIWPER